MKKSDRPADGVGRAGEGSQTNLLHLPDAERPPKRLIAHTGTRYDISDLREIYGPGRRNSAGSSGGCSSGGGLQFSSSDDVCADPLRFESSAETRGVPSSGAGPSQNGTCSGSGIGRKIRVGRSDVNCFRFGRTRVCITIISLHRVNIIGSVGNEPQHSIVQAVVSYICLLYLRPYFLSCLSSTPGIFCMCFC